MKKSSHLELTANGVFRTITKLVALLGCSKVDNEGNVVNPQLPEGEDLCRLILGDDFLSTEDIAKVYGWSYSDDQLRNFTKTLPDLKELGCLVNNNYMLVAGPPMKMNLPQIYKHNPHIFYAEYTGDRYKFSPMDKVSAKWLKFRKDEVPNSSCRNWEEQQKLISKSEYVPNVSEVSYAIAAYYRVRNVRLFEHKSVRTCSLDVNGRCIDVGDFQDRGRLIGGIHVNCRWGTEKPSFIGVSSAWK